MQQLIPDLRTVDDPAVLIAADDRHPPAGRPWVMANMVMSIDGAYSRDGRSAGLSGDADRAMFAALRTLADVVLVAAGTARAERYRRPAAVPGHGSARLAVVTRSARIPDDQPFLSGEGPDPIVFHPSDADTSSVPSGVELRASGTTDVDLAGSLANLRSDGAELVLCEGGPNLLGQLVGAGLLDELFVTLAPTVVGGDHVGLIGANGPFATSFDLHRLIEDDGFLLLCYRSS